MNKKDPDPLPSGDDGTGFGWDLDTVFTIEVSGGKEHLL